MLIRLKGKDKIKIYSVLNELELALVCYSIFSISSDTLRKEHPLVGQRHLLSSFFKVNIFKLFLYTKEIKIIILDEKLITIFFINEKISFLLIFQV